MRAPAHRISRRRMLAASGAAVTAPAVLAACGQASDEEDDRSEAADPDLLNPILAQHLAVQKATKGLDFTEALGPDDTEILTKARADSIAQLESFIEEAGGEASTEPADAAAAESMAEALALQLEDSIAASLASIGELSSAASRQAVHRFITEDAAALAALRSQLGNDVSPDAFVFGAPSAEDSE